MKKFLNVKIITLIILLLIVILLMIPQIRLNTSKLINKVLGLEDVNDKVHLLVDVKSESDGVKKCLLIFTSQDGYQIKSIQYPERSEQANTNDNTGTNSSNNNVLNANNKSKIAIDYDIDTENEEQTFLVTLSDGEILPIKTTYKIDFYDINNQLIETKNILKTAKYDLELESNTSNYVFMGWTENQTDIVGTYYTSYVYHYEDDIKLWSKWLTYTDYLAWQKDNDSLIGKIANSETAGVSTLTANNETYNVDTIIYNGNLVLDGTTAVNGATLSDNIYEFGNETTDCGTSSAYANNMVVLKVNGNLTINENVTLTTCKNSDGYGGPKGLFIYCTGKIINNGTISMTQRGAYAEGQDVYLWKGEEKIATTYEFVPKVGAAGGARVYDRSGGWAKGKNGGTNESIRATGGGGSGAHHEFFSYALGTYSGAGSAGTSYSGGSGGAGSNQRTGNNLDAIGNGGAGGYDTKLESCGGAGNPGNVNNSGGSNGTGGLLNIYALTITNNGTISSEGSDGSTYGGASGGGSINLFYTDNYTNAGNVTANGGSSTNGGAGGKGAMNVGMITGIYVKGTI